MLPQSTWAGQPILSRRPLILRFRLRCCLRRHARLLWLRLCLRLGKLLRDGLRELLRSQFHRSGFVGEGCGGVAELGSCRGGPRGHGAARRGQGQEQERDGQTRLSPFLTGSL